MINKNRNFYILLAVILLVSIICYGCDAQSSTPYDYGELVYVNLNFEDCSHSLWEGQYTESQ